HGSTFLSILLRHQPLCHCLRTEVTDSSGTRRGIGSLSVDVFVASPSASRVRLATPQQGKPEVTPHAASEGQRNPEHRPRLQKAGLLQFPGIDGIKTDVTRKLHHHGLRRLVVAANEHHGTDTWACNEGEGARVDFERATTEKVIAGGMGGAP